MQVQRERQTTARPRTSVSVELKEASLKKTCLNIRRSLTNHLRNENVKTFIAYSTPNRTLIPRQTEHGFHSKASADSTANRAGIPRLPEREFHA